MFKPQLSLHFSFSIRTPKQNVSASIVLRLSLNRERTYFYKTGLVVNSSEWVPEKQGLGDDHPHAKLLADELETVRQQHEQIWAEQEALICGNGKPFRVSAYTIKEQWLTKVSPVSSGRLIDLYDDYLHYLKTRPSGERLSTKTINQLQVVRDHIINFLSHTNQASLTIDDLSQGWGRRFYDWLKLSRDATTAARYVGKVRNALQHAADYDQIKSNPLATLRLKGSKKKAILHLTKDQLADLYTTDIHSKWSVARNWALLQAYTALDFHDAIAVAKNQGQYVRHTPDGDKLIYQRLKYKDSTEWGECHIPILPEAAVLLSDAKTWPKLAIGVYNKHLKKISKELGLSFMLHSKLLRKTGGSVFLQKGYDINAVQKIMGHQSRSTTEKFYCDLPAIVVDRQMKEVGQRRPTEPTSNFPFLTFIKSRNAI